MRAVAAGAQQRAAPRSYGLLHHPAYSGAVEAW